MGKIADLTLEWLSLRMPFGGGKQHSKVLSDALVGSKTVLDVGCGRGTFKVYRQYESTGIEIFPESVAKARENGNYKRVFCLDVRNIPSNEMSFDTVTCTEVIEHLTKEEGWELLDKLEAIAKKKVVIMTPWGLDILPKREDNPYLNHQSGWFPMDFTKRGYKIIPFTSIRWRWDNNFIQLVLAYSLSIVLQPLIKMYPDRFCNDFAAIKEINGSN